MKALRHRLPLACALLAIALAIPGCITKGGDEDSTPASTLNVNETENYADNATLPDDRGESAGLKETNKTESGLGGKHHRHDYWKGQDKVVVFDDLVYFSATPVFPDGEGTSPKSVAYVKLPAPNLVYEGAATVEVLAASAGLGIASDLPMVPNPAPPALSFQYRSAADTDWRDPVQLAYDAPLVIPVAPKETDMPHSVSSLWVFRITTDKPIEGQYVKLTITAVKGQEVVDWPGHPDFYAKKPWRIVLDRDVTTRMSGVTEGMLYDAGGTWVQPEKLVSYGTTRLEVFINVSGIGNAFGREATGYFLESHNATVIGPEIRFGDRWSDADGSSDLKSWNFTIPVDEAGMDGPYQPESRWGFRAMATFADIDFPTGGGIGLCPGCFPYDITYHITVIAVNDEHAVELDE